jgi:hypothetical protein
VPNKEVVRKRVEQIFIEQSPGLGKRFKGSHNGDALFASSANIIFQQ